LIRFQTRFWLLGCVALAFATRLAGLERQSLWFDEIITVTLARLPWYEGLVGLLGQGIQLTPLFHWVIKLVLLLGDRDWLLRLPAALVGVLTIPLIFQAGRRFFDARTGLLAALLFAINPYQVWYGQELKLYTLLPLAAAGAMLAFSRLVASNGRRGLVPLLIFNVLGFPAHYFMFLIPTVQFLYILIFFKQTHRLLWPWMAAQLLSVLPLLPWWFFIVQQQHFAVGIGWIPRPQWSDPLLTFWNFSLAYTGELSLLTGLALGVAGLGLALGLRRAWSRPRSGLLLSLWLFFPPLVTALLSFRTLSFYVDRYLLVVAPVLTILLAAGLLAGPKPALRRGLILIFIGATAWSLGRVYWDRDNFSKEDWRGLVQSLDAQAEAGQVIITCTDGHWLSFDYYNPARQLRPDQVIFASRGLTLPPASQAAWVIATHEGLPTHYLGKSLPPQPDRGRLSAETARWEATHRQDTLVVPGITAYYYDNAAAPALPEVVRWHCERQGSKGAG
jgi:4-amino-4-deoxy-L-arabinose transferase-like glycosyltransferase